MSFEATDDPPENLRPWDTAKRAAVGTFVWVIARKEIPALIVDLCDAFEHLYALFEWVLSDNYIAYANRTGAFDKNYLAGIQRRPHGVALDLKRISSPEEEEDPIFPARFRDLHIGKR